MKLDLNQALEQLAQAFNTTVDKLYPMLIKQAYVSGVSSILLILFSWIVLGVVVHIFKKHGVKKGSYNTLTSGTVGFIIATVLISIVTVLITMIAGSNAITALINPEYWALTKVLYYVK